MSQLKPNVKKLSVEDLKSIRGAASVGTESIKGEDSAGAKMEINNT